METFPDFASYLEGVQSNSKYKRTLYNAVTYLILYCLGTDIRKQSE